MLDVAIYALNAAGGLALGVLTSQGLRRFRRILVFAGVVCAVVGSWYAVEFWRNVRRAYASAELPSGFDSTRQGLASSIALALLGVGMTVDVLRRARRPAG